MSVVTRIRTSQELTVPFTREQVWAVLADVEAYPDWWPAKLRVQVLHHTGELLGAEFEVRPFLGRMFRIRFEELEGERTMRLRFFGGSLEGPGGFHLHAIEDGTEVRYEMDVFARGLDVAALSTVVPLDRIHRSRMRSVLNSLAVRLKTLHKASEREAAESAQARERANALRQAEADAATRRAAEERARKVELEAQAARLAREEAAKNRAEERARRAAEEEDARLARAEVERKRAEEVALALAAAELTRKAAEEKALALAAAEEERRRLEEEAARLAFEEAEKKREEQEAARRAAEEEAARLALEAVERKRAEEEAIAVAAEEARRRAEEEAAARAAAEEAARRAAEEEATALAAAELVRKAAEEVALARAAAEEERRRIDVEAARLALEEAERKRAEAEEAAKKRLEEEAAARAAADEAARRAAEEEAIALAAAELARKAAEEEVLALAAAEEERRRIEEEAAARAVVEEGARRAAEEEAARLALEEAEKKRADAEEAAKKRAEEEVARVALEEAARKRAAAEALAAEEEARKQAEEEATIRRADALSRIDTAERKRLAVHELAARAAAEAAKSYVSGDVDHAAAADQRDTGARSRSLLSRLGSWLHDAPAPATPAPTGAQLTGPPAADLTESNFEIARRYLGALSANAPPDQIGDFLAPEVAEEEFSHRFQSMAATRGREGMLEARARALSRFASQRYQLAGATGGGSLVAMEVRWRGTVATTGEGFAQGQEFDARMAMFLKFAEGKIVRQRVYPCFEPWSTKAERAMILDERVAQAGERASTSQTRRASSREAQGSNFEISRRYLDALGSRADADAIAHFFAQDAVQDEFPNRFLPAGAQRDLLAIRLARTRGLALLEFENYELIGATGGGSQVALEVVWTGVAGENPGVFVVGQRLEARLGIFLTFRDGLIVSQRNYDCPLTHMSVAR